MENIMETITKFKANDGTEFNDKQKCIDHENLLEEIKEIISKLEPKKVSCDFSNGSGYILQNPKTFRDVRKSILEIAKRFTDHHWIQESIDKQLEVDPSWAGRIISECCPDCVWKAWSRISCTTNDYKEYGQQYYRNNPEKAKNICLN